MEGVRNAFIGLLRSGLWGRDPVAEGFQRLSDEQWNMVFRLSGRQTVTGIVFDGICRLPEDLQPSPAIFAPWVVAVDRIERSNERMNDVLKSLVKLFADNGLNPVLQKGQGVAALYPEPLHRECGDIDLYFPEGLSLRQAQRPDNVAQRPSAESAEASEMTENGKAAELVRNRGAKVETMPDGSQNYEWEGIEIEQHPTIVDLCSPRTRKWLGELDDDPGFIPSTLADGLLVPSPELNALLLNSHILKHTLGKGIGLRQMCDLAMVYHQISGAAGCDEYGERIFRLYRRGRILKWSSLLHSFLVDIIGLRKEELPYSERDVSPEPLLRIVEEGGNFGQYRGEDSGHSGTSTSSATGRLSDRKRKLKTAGMFLRRAGFSMRFAPKEAFWTFWELVKGQFRK
ncbi:MAG TPA: hypothetical protein DDX40_04440 [Rikenellaceae bacterium]|nr:hypothetical protein [Rikenellaceae bacterium]